MTPPDTRRGGLPIKPVLKWGLPFLLLLLIAIPFRREVSTAISPFVVAFVLAYILDPVVGFIQRGRIPIGRLGAVVVLYVALVSVLLFLLFGVVPRLAGEAQDLVSAAWIKYFPRLEQASREWIERTAPRVRRAAEQAREGADAEAPAAPPEVPSATPSGVPVAATGEVAVATGEEDLSPILDSLSDPETRRQLVAIARGGWSVVDVVLTGIRNLVFGLVTRVTNFIGSLVNVTLALIILFYLLLDFPSIRRGGKALIPAAHAPKVLRILAAIDGQLSAYLRGQVTVSICVGVLVAVGLVAVGLVLNLSVARYALLIGLCAGIFNLVPYLGPVMGATPAVILTIVDLYQPGVQGMWSAMLIQVGVIIALFVLVQLADGLLISPRIMGNRLDMHPMLIMFVLMLGGGIGGFIGMLAAVPIACVIRTLILEIYVRKEPAPAA